MSGYECLLHQTRHRYEWLSKAIVGVSLEQAKFAFNERRPSIAWEVGHVVQNADSVAEAVCGLERLLPPTFMERLGERHSGVTSDDDWTELRETWFRVERRTLAGLGTLADSDLELPPAVEVHADFRSWLTSRRAFWSGHVFHVAYHLGQIGMLRAELELGWSIGQ